MTLQTTRPFFQLAESDWLNLELKLICAALMTSRQIDVSEVSAIRFLP